MKVYLILLVISGICHFIQYLEVATFIKENELKRIKKDCIEKRIASGIKLLIIWALIIPNILLIIINIFAHDFYEESMYDSFMNSEYWG